MDTNTIEQLIKVGLADAQVTVNGDDGVHFDAIVVSDNFKDRRTLERHRLVYRTLGERMGGDIHALALSTYTVEEWQQKSRKAAV